jgi:hypothetical protein
MHPPSKIHPSTIINQYATKYPQRLMRKGVRVMENPPGVCLASDLSSFGQIELFIPPQCALSAENPQSCALLPQHTTETELN